MGKYRLKKEIYPEVNYPEVNYPEVPFNRSFGSMREVLKEG